MKHPNKGYFNGHITLAYLREKHLGYFKTKKNAIAARLKAANKIQGVFASH